MRRREWPFICSKIYNKIQQLKKTIPVYSVSTRSRSTTITPEIIGWKFRIYNGKTYYDLKIAESMVGHKLGEFSPTRYRGVHKRKTNHKKV